MRGYALIPRGVVFPAPWLEWGAVEGTTAGDLLRVAYTTTHGTVVSATLDPADHRRLAFDVFDDRLELALPADLANGPATITALLVDGAGNTSTAELVVALTGTIVPPPVPRPAGGYRARPDVRRISSPATVAIATGPTWMGRRQPMTVTIIGLPAARRARTLVPGRIVVPATLAVESASRLRVQFVTETARLRLLGAETAVGRRDGPQLEEALLLELV